MTAYPTTTDPRPAKKEETTPDPESNPATVKLARQDRLFFESIQWFLAGIIYCCAAQVVALNAEDVLHLLIAALDAIVGILCLIMSKATHSASEDDS